MLENPHFGLAQPFWVQFVGACVRSVLSTPLRPHGLQPARLLCPWDSPGKNTGVGCLSRGSSQPRDQTCVTCIPGIKPVSPVLADEFFTTEPPAKPGFSLVTYNLGNHGNIPL